jgi:hypothetical protein
VFAPVTNNPGNRRKFPCAAAIVRIIGFDCYNPAPFRPAVPGLPRSGLMLHGARLSCPGQTDAPSAAPHRPDPKPETDEIRYMADDRKDRKDWEALAQ